jgi:hypothetical protein
MPLWKITLEQGVADVQIYSPFSLGPGRLEQFAKELQEAARILRDPQRAAAEAGLAPTMEAVREGEEDGPKRDSLMVLIDSMEKRAPGSEIDLVAPILRRLAQRVHLAQINHDDLVKRLDANDEEEARSAKLAVLMANDIGTLAKRANDLEKLVAAQADVLRGHARGIHTNTKRMTDDGELFEAWVRNVRHLTGRVDDLTTRVRRIIDGDDAESADAALREYDEKGGTTLDELRAELESLHERIERHHARASQRPWTEEEYGRLSKLMKENPKPERRLWTKEDLAHAKSDRKDTRPVRLVPDAGGMERYPGTYCAWFENGAVIIEERAAYPGAVMHFIGDHPGTGGGPWIRFRMRPSTSGAPDVWFTSAQAMWVEPYSDHGYVTLYAGVERPPSKTAQPEHTGISG